jgi:hypothetical protein
VSSHHDQNLRGSHQPRAIMIGTELSPQIWAL